MSTRYWILELLPFLYLLLTASEAQQFGTFYINATNLGVNFGATFCPVFDVGTNITCSICHGDETGSIWLEGDYSDTICNTYNFTSAGYKNITTYCVDDTKFAVDNQMVYIGSAIKFLIVEDTNKNIFIPMKRTEVKTITVTFDEGTDVMVNATIIDTGDNLHLSYNGSSISPINFDVSETSLPGIGQHAVEVVVWNDLSLFKRYLVFAVADDITGYVGTMNISDPYNLLVDDTVTFQIDTTGGSDIIYATEIGGTAYLEKTTGHVGSYQYTHTFNATGVFDILLSASNYVTGFETAAIFSVVYPVNKVNASVPEYAEYPTITLTFGMDSDAGLPMGTLFGFIELEGNYTIDNISLSALSPGSLLTYDITTLPPGSHNIFVSIHSETSSMNFTLPVLLQKRIQPLDFLYPQEAKLSDAQSLSVRLQNPADGPLYNITCMFNVSGVEYSEVLSLSGTDNGTVSVSFPDTGLIQIHVNCSNYINFVEMTGQVNVTSDCFEVANLFSEDYKNELTPLSMYITNDNTITSKGVITLRCRNSSREYFWELWPKLKNGSFIKDHYYSNPNNQPKSASIFFGKETISEGQYKLRLIVNLTDLGQSMQDDMYVEFRLPPIVTGIAGGSTRYVNQLKDLILDAGSVTKDKVLKYKNVPFQYDWICRQGVAIADVDKVQGEFGLSGGTTIDTVGTPCSGATPSGSLWTIPAASLLNQWYLIHVTANKTSTSTVAGLETADTTRSATGIQAVFPQAGNPPAMEILCKRNCLPKLSKNSLLILNADCAECDSSQTNYEWKIYIYDGTTKTFVSIDTVPRIDQSVLLETTLTADEIGITTSAFDDQDRIKFELKVTTSGRPTAHAEYIVSANAPPYGGTCKIEPTTGIAVKEWFRISCNDWKDEGDRYERDPVPDATELLTYSVYHVRRTAFNDTLESLLSESDDNSASSTLSVGDPNNNYISEIRIHIKDFYNGYVVLTLPVTVQNPLEIDRQTMADAEIIGNVTQLLTDELLEAESSNDPKQILHQAQVLAAVIIIIPMYSEKFNITPEPSDWTSGLLDADVNGTKKYDDMLTDLLKYNQDPVLLVIEQAIENLTQIMENQLESNATTFFMIELAGNAFGNAVENNQVVTVDAGISAANALIILSTNLKNVSDMALTSEAMFDSSDPRLESASKAILGLVSAVVGVTLTSNFSDNELGIIAQTTSISRAQVEYFAKIYGDDAYNLMENADITPEERTGLYLIRARIDQAEFEERQALAAITTVAIDRALQDIIDQGLNLTCKGCDTTHTENNVLLVLAKTALQDLNQAAASLLGNESILMQVVKSTDSNDTTLLGVAVFPQNVYIAGNIDAVLITSNVYKLSLKDDKDNDLAQKEVAVNFTAKASFSTQNLPSYTEGDASQLFYHSLFYRATGDYVCVSIETVIPDYVTSYDVYVKEETAPTHLDYNGKGEVSPYNDWMTCFPPQIFSTTGEVHVGLHANSKIGLSKGRRKRSVGNFAGFMWEPTTGQYANGTYNISKAELLPYLFKVITSACKEWDPKSQSWNSDSCKMDWFPDKNITECTCHPSYGLTFGNTFYVAPNTIDFSSVFLKFDPKSQAAVLGTLIGILVIYILLLIWARHQDKRDVVRWGVTPLIDNFVDDTYYYLITVYTGMRKGAGTKSRIGFIVCGEDGDTGIRELSDGVRTEIPTASVVHFLMSTPYPLGDLSYVYIWHDNTGEGDTSSWYLNRVDVEDIQKKERFVFLCGKWLCLDSEDSSVDAVLPVCGKENVTTFSNMFYLNTKENLADNHMWIAIFFRPTSSHYSRCQRLTCFLLFIFLTMIGNAIYFRPEDEYTNAGTDIRVGPFSFSPRSIYIAFICALISTPTVILVIMLFKKSKPRKNVSYNIKQSSRKYRVPVIDTWMDKMMAESKELEKTLVAKGLFNTDGTILPYWCAYIAWFLAVGGIAACCFFVLLYSMQWGQKKSEVWLGQFFLSFFSSTCLVDPLKVLLMSAIFAMLLKQTDKFRPTGLERSFILKNYKQRFGYESGIRLPAPPLDTSSLKRARQEREKELRMMESVKQVIITCVCLWIIFSICYSNRDTRSFNFHQNIATKLLTPQDKTLQQFHKITTIEDLLRWLRFTAFPVLYPDEDYTGDRLHWRLRQYFHDLTSYRVGPPRLRQLRVVPENTDIPYFGDTLTSPKYSIVGEEDEDFCFGWVKGQCDLEKEARSFSYAGWKFTSSFDIWGIPIPGRYKTYGGGGYITELDVNFDFSNRTLTELTDFLWFDKNTRAVFLEFNLYTPDLNLFAYSLFLAEMPETGGIITHYSIYPFRVYHHLGSTGIYTLFCEVVFVCFLVALIIKVAYGIVKKRKAFFKDVWNCMDLTCIVLSLVCIAMYAGRYLLAAATMDKFKEDAKQFINFQHIAIWDFLFNLLLSCLAFIATLRLVGILGYDKRVGQVFRVFENCAQDLFWFGVFFLYVFFCYAALGYLLFGRDIASYSDIFESLGTLFISMIGKSKFTEINEKDPIMAQFYFFTFILLLVYTLLTMFLAILGESINAVHNMTKRSREEELIEYLLNKFKKLFGNPQTQQNTGKKTELQNKPIGFLYDLRQGINDAFDKYSDDGKPLPPAIIDFEKRAKMFEEKLQK